MNWLDYLIIAILLLSTIGSIRKGFSREIIGLASSLAALILAMWFYGLAGSWLQPYTHSERMANLAGFLLVVCAVMLAGSLLGWVVNRFLRTVGLSFFDRALGAVFGLVRGVLVAMALITGFIAFGPYIETSATPMAVVHSKLAPWLLEASRLSVAMAPMQLKSSFRQQYEQVRAALDRDVQARKQ